MCTWTHMHRHIHLTHAHTHHSLKSIIIYEYDIMDTVPTKRQDDPLKKVISIRSSREQKPF